MASIIFIRYLFLIGICLSVNGINCLQSCPCNELNTRNSSPKYSSGISGEECAKYEGIYYQHSHQCQCCLLYKKMNESCKPMDRNDLVVKCAEGLSCNEQNVCTENKDNTRIILVLQRPRHGLNGQSFAKRFAQLIQSMLRCDCSRIKCNDEITRSECERYQGLFVDKLTQKTGCQCCDRCYIPRGHYQRCDGSHTKSIQLVCDAGLTCSPFRHVCVEKRELFSTRAIQPSRAYNMGPKRWTQVADTAENEMIGNSFSEPLVRTKRSLSGDIALNRKKRDDEADPATAPDDTNPATAPTPEDNTLQAAAPTPAPNAAKDKAKAEAKEATKAAKEATKEAAKATAKATKEAAKVTAKAVATAAKVTAKATAKAAKATAVAAKAVHKAAKASAKARKEAKAAAAAAVAATSTTTTTPHVSTDGEDKTLKAGQEEPDVATAPSDDPTTPAPKGSTESGGEDKNLKEHTLQAEAPEEDKKLKEHTLQSAAPEEDKKLKEHTLQAAAPEEDKNLKEHTLQSAAPEEDKNLKEHTLQSAAPEEDKKLKAEPEPDVALKEAAPTTAEPDVATAPDDVTLKAEAATESGGISGFLKKWGEDIKKEQKELAEVINKIASTEAPASEDKRY
ncbi:unnamed protein product [Medioppia subpectinata]|uniref:Uncharacterized protein n=1 Tax=Medioppia subpectinata TaxID=1979941 RepID=A0A7R9L9R8_9ACAR|nr:unnamed protein product [Medioppia subpectinata]CAG2116725.1 unnamed protein product [Medioppia subpectinata]